MNLIWLEDFLALASAGNFSRAAEERHMTQPAFSRRIRALEEWLGVVLFDRSVHPVKLTETGEWFRTVAQEMLARVERIPEEAGVVADAASATLRIAATHALSFTFLPGWLRGLESRVAVGPIQLISDVMQQCETQMAQARVQFLLCHSHPQVPNRLDESARVSARVGNDALIPVTAPAGDGSPLHRLDGGTAVPILAYSAESGIGRIVRALRGAELSRIDAQFVFTAHLATVLKPLVLDGRGVAWLPESLIGDELAAGTLVAAGDPRWAIEVEIRLFRQRAPMPSAAEGLWRAATATVAR